MRKMITNGRIMAEIYDLLIMYNKLRKLENA